MTSRIAYKGAERPEKWHGRGALLASECRVSCIARDAQRLERPREFSLLFNAGGCHSRAL